MRTHEVGGFTKTLVLNDYDSYNTMDVPYFTRLDNLLKVLLYIYLYCTKCIYYRNGNMIMLLTLLFGNPLV